MLQVSSFRSYVQYKLHIARIRRHHSSKLINWNSYFMLNISLEFLKCVWIRVKHCFPNYYINKNPLLSNAEETALR